MPQLQARRALPLEDRPQGQKGPRRLNLRRGPLRGKPGNYARIQFGGAGGQATALRPNRQSNGLPPQQFA